MFRAFDHSGPWAERAEAPRREGDWTIVLDRASPGEVRHYRLDLTLEDGAETTFGPIAATLFSGETRLVGVSPTPGTGALTVDFALASGGKEARRVTIVR